MTIDPRITHDMLVAPADEARRLMRRAALQLEFARAFAALFPDRATTWMTAIDSAELSFSGYAAGSGAAGLADTVSSIESQLSEIGSIAKSYRIHCVGHGHIDMNWMWSWSETVATGHDTFASVLSLMRKYPDLTYSQSQGSVYAIMERYHPDMFEEIKARVNEGRWEVSASHWVEGDKNLASGESICRHLLYTRQYFLNRFGLSPEDQPIDWEPDTFGHAATIPSFLRQGAVKYYYSCRTGGGFDHARIGDSRPPLFYWRAPDGATVLVNRETTWYNSYFNIGENIALPLVDFVSNTGRRDWLNVFGLGNHGGGPTQAEIAYLHELQSWPIYPTIEFSTTKRYFEAVESQADEGLKPIPVIEHELNFEFTGCYTSQSVIKQANRFGENFVLEAETLSAIGCQILQMPYPEELLREAWLKVLFNQFHDILPGSGVRETREHASAAFQEIGAITGSIKRNVLKRLASRIDTASLLPDTWPGNRERQRASEPGFGSDFEAGAGLGASPCGMSAGGSYGDRFRPYVVFNPCCWERSETITATVYDAGFDPDSVVVISADGNVQSVLHHFDESGDAWKHARQVFSFPACAIPALGFKTFVLCEASSLSRSQTRSITKQNVATGANESVETPFLSLHFDRDQGGIRDLTDKRSGAVIMPRQPGTPLGGFEFVVERVADMTSWLLGAQTDPPVQLRAKSFDYIGRNHFLLNSDQAGTSPDGLVVKSQLAVPGTDSAVRLRIAVSDKAPRVDFEAVIDWREIGTKDRGVPGLVVVIPLAFTSITATYEVPFGYVTRNLNSGEETPSLRYAHVEGTAKTSDGRDVFAGLTLIQDCKYGHSIDGNPRDGYVLRLRMVRSSFDPDPTPEVAITTVRYAIVLHDKPCGADELARLGAAMNHPLIVAPAGVHTGTLPTQCGFARIADAAVLVTAVKKAEAGDGMILRLSNPTGETTIATAALNLDFVAGYTNATAVDLMERPVGEPLPIRDGVIEAPIGPFSFVSLLLR